MPTASISQKEIKIAVNRLLMVRQNIAPEAEFIGAPKINQLLDDLRAIDLGNDSERQEWVLRAVKRQQAGTVQEVAEDTRLSVVDVREILQQLGIDLPDEDSIDFEEKLTVLKTLQ